MPTPHSRLYRFFTADCPAWACRMFRFMPWSWARSIGAALGLLGYYLVPRVRHVALQNLDLAYGDALSLAKKRRIAKDAARNVGIVAAEFTRIPLLAGPDIDRLADVRGLERVDPQQGALLIAPHLSNWEWLAPALSAKGRPVAEIVRPLDFPSLNAFVDATRRAGGCDTIPKEQAGAEVVSRLRAGELVGALIDQCPRTSGVPVTFFGRPCWSTVAPVMAAFRAKVPVHPVCCARQPDGRYLVEVGDAISLKREGELHDDLVLNSQRCQDAIEAIVRRYPGQWLWMHRRWKRRERLEEEWAQRIGR